MQRSRPTQLRILATALLTIAMGYVAQPAIAQQTTGDRAPATAGPTGTPDTTGAIRQGNQIDGGMAGTDANRDSIEAEDFFEEASALGVAEITTSQKALQHSQNDAVKAFAERMVKEHAAANEKMADMAAGKNLEISDEAGLMDRARAWILEARDGEDFDAAYANNQVAAHERSIELFERASRSDDAEVAAFARETLPRLQKHLEEARQLAQSTPDT